MLALLAGFVVSSPGCQVLRHSQPEFSRVAPLRRALLKRVTLVYAEAYKGDPGDLHFYQANVTNPREMEALRHAVLAATQKPGWHDDYVGEKGGYVDFVSKTGWGVRLQMFPAELDRRWGPEVKRLYRKYRARAKRMPE